MNNVVFIQNTGSTTGSVGNTGNANQQVPTIPNPSVPLPCSIDAQTNEPEMSIPTIEPEPEIVKLEPEPEIEQASSILTEDMHITNQLQSAIQKYNLRICFIRVASLLSQLGLLLLCHDSRL